MSGFGSLEGWDAWKKTDAWKKYDGWLSSGGGDDASGPLVDGLIRNREALMSGPAAVATGPTASAASKGSTARAIRHLKLNDPDELSMCGSDARMKVLVLELLQDLRFAPAQSNAATVTVGSGDEAPLLVKVIRPSEGKFRSQAGEVMKWAPRRAERAPEILSQVGPQMAYWSSIVNLSPERTPKTLEFCNTAMTFASFVVQRVKHILSCQRPLAYDRNIQPMIPTPAFSAMPSGHATEAFMMAHLLTQLCQLDANGAALLQRQADRIATNRVIAGLHFPVDSIAGRMLGQTLAEYLLRRSIGTDWYARTFVGTAVEGNTPFKYDEGMDTNGVRSYFQSELGGTVDQSPILNWLWDRCDGGNA
jgi:PAP2 superfamily